MRPGSASRATGKAAMRNSLRVVALLLVLLWLALGERHMARRLAPFRANLPVDDLGRWDTTRPQPFRRYKAAVLRESRRVEQTLILAVSGREDLARTQRRSAPRGGIVYPTLRRIADQRLITWQRSLEIAKEDGPFATPPALLTGPAVPPARARRQRSLSEIARERGRQARAAAAARGDAGGSGGGEGTDDPPIGPRVPRSEDDDRISQEPSRRDRKRAAIEEIGADGEENPRRNIAHTTRRWREETARLLNPYGGPKALDDVWERTRRDVLDAAREDYLNTPPDGRAWNDELDEFARRWLRGPARDSGLEGLDS